ncbi:MAG: hypothetical protein EPO22_03160 [Dehalococcoidia bacterium]|nr:MAG: hypothetical protein EPO22_03160 [Dehalococcoidia bacterium]
MQVKLAVLADFASISREGKINIMGIFDEMNPQRLPVTLPIFYVVVSYSTDAVEFDTEKNVEIALQDEDGQILVRLHQTMRVPRPTRPGTRGIVNQVHALVNLPFQSAGNYEFVISVDGRPEGHIPLRINAPIEEGAA